MLLVNDADVIHARKPELPVSMISEQLQEFQAELPRWGEHVIVRTDESAVAVTERIALRVLELSGNRALERVRRGSLDAMHGWHSRGRGMRRSWSVQMTLLPMRCWLYSPYSWRVLRPSGRSA